MTNKKLKILWMCYFSNSKIQEIIKPFKPVREFSPWMRSMIHLFENDKKIELHIVSQHEWINRNKNFNRNGISYHFFNSGIPFIGRHWPGFFKLDSWTDFLIPKKNSTDYK
jgi:hypothetical protein